MFLYPRFPSSRWLVPSFSKASYYRATPSDHTRLSLSRCHWNRCCWATSDLPQLRQWCWPAFTFHDSYDLGQCWPFFPSWNSLCSLFPWHLLPCVGSYFSDSFFPALFADISPSACPIHVHLHRVLGDLIHTHGLNDHILYVLRTPHTFCSSRQNSILAS